MFKKYWKLIVISFSLLLSKSLFASEELDPNNMARVRVFREATISLYPGENCYGSKSPQLIHASTGVPSFFSYNTTIGMPTTEDTPKAYNEYTIAAGKPVAVMLQWQAEQNGQTASCGPIGATFYPQAGRDYDVTIGFASSCYVQVRELYLVAPGKATAKRSPVGSSYACLER